jgi:excisionase family DNA binding protein
MPIELPSFFTVDEVAARLRVHRTTVYAACERGVIRHARIGKRIVIPEDALVEYLAEIQRRPPPATIELRHLA